MGPQPLAVRVFAVLGALGLLFAIAATIAEARLAGKAVRAQRVRPSSEAALFGDIGETIGSPQLYIVDDPKAFLAHDGPGGLKLIDETYLEKTGKYPLQLQTVRFGAGIARIVGIAEAVGCGLVAFVLSRRKAMPE